MALPLVFARRVRELLINGSLTLDLGLGRRIQPLGPVSWEIAAARERVFDIIEAPYAGRQPRALAEKVQVWERGQDMVLAAHRTKFRRRTVTTLETVRFHRPERIDFRLVRGPVPHLCESFELEQLEQRTRLTWSGELGTDLGPPGTWWGRLVATAWRAAVESSVAAIKAEAERQTRPQQ